MGATEAFPADFDLGASGGRRLPHERPDLPFGDGQFDLAPSAHLRFAHSGPLSADFHCQAMPAMRRVVKELRVFPLLGHGGHPLLTTAYAAV
jgi:hypothetical protein